MPNQYGGNEDLDAVSFLKELNEVALRARAGRDLARPRSRPRGRASRGPTYLGGLGFGFKWNMGWMHDTLAYFQHDPIYRRYHHHELTFSLVYAFTENFILPLVARRGRARQGLAALQDAGRPLAEARQPARAVRLHVGAPRQEAAVHGPGVRPGGRVEPRALARLAPAREPASTPASSRSCATSTAPTGPSRRCGSMDFDGEGFWWIEPNDAEDNVIAFARASEDGERVRRVRRQPLAGAARATTGSGCRAPGRWREVINTDSGFYGGSDVGQPTAASRPSRSRGTASRSRPRSRCRRWARLARARGDKPNHARRRS